MIRILMLDLGETLVHDNVPFPHVPEALEALQKFTSATGKPLELCLVSDFGPQPPVPKSKVTALVKEYVSLLDSFGLKQFFEPTSKRVTLSAHANAFKPDRRVFETAIARLAIHASLNECLFVTENADHIAACRKLTMETLQFGVSDPAGDAFTDWSEGPLLISHLIAPEREDNLELALNVRLAVTHGMELIEMNKKPQTRRIRGRANKWQPVPDPKEAGKKIEVAIPVDLELTLNKQGRLQSVEPGQTRPETIDEAAHAVRHPPQSGWLDELDRLKGGWRVSRSASSKSTLVSNCGILASDLVVEAILSMRQKI